MGIRLWGPADDGDTALESALTAPAPLALDAGAADRGPSALPAIDRSAPKASSDSPAPRRSDDAGAADARATWQLLVDEAANCTRCALCAGRTRPVFDAGHRQADWMVVGDAPEAEDDRAGEPFAGHTGRLLDNMLAALALGRVEAARLRPVYLTQAVKCHPPDSRNPESAELVACEAFLRRQVALVRPRIIVALGRVAAEALLGRAEPIGRLRGRIHRYAGVPVVATHHPLFLLRQPEAKAEAWDDLCLALETVTDSGDA